MPICGEKSGRLDLNQRPFGPQPNALPDCATPRGTCSVYARFVRPQCEHMFVSASEPQMVRCYRCGESKPAEDFAWRRKTRGQRDSFCRPCRSAYGREHYEANRQHYIEQAAKVKRRLMRERTLLLIDYFKSHPCVECGEADPIVLEFDHLRDKSFTIGQSLLKRRWRDIVAEMEKCEVVCANCHRRRTAERRSSFRAVLTKK